jgi:hypothetical protein
MKVTQQKSYSYYLKKTIPFGLFPNSAKFQSLVYRRFGKFDVCRIGFGRIGFFIYFAEPDNQFGKICRITTSE